METDFSKPLSDDELKILHGRNPDHPSEESSDIATAVADEIEAAAPPEENTDGGQELQGQVEGQQDGEQGGTEAAQEPQTDAWITESVLKYSETYGFTPDDLRDFGSQEELERVAAKLDKYMGRILQAPADKAPVGQQQVANPSQSQATDPPAPEPVVAPLPDRPGFKNGKIDLDYFKSNYEPDDPVIAIVEHAAAQEGGLSKTLQEIEQLKSHNAAVIEYMARQEQAAQTNALHSAMDSYNPDFYGKAFDDHGNPVKLADDVMKRRTEVYDTINNVLWPMIQRQEQLGQLPRVPTFPELVHRAAQVVHSKELAQIESKKKADALVAQNKKIRQVANASNGYRPRTPARGPMNDFEKLNTNPVLLEQWEQLEKEGLV